ncbi:MAG TPA: hypothetical protein VLF40_05240 [Candidatus Saccharimonadales bacterium]|nr:hypothetical protein [Candidatus Saccharimonadales bacterium]
MGVSAWAIALSGAVPSICIMLVFVVPEVLSHFRKSKELKVQELRERRLLIEAERGVQTAGDDTQA